MTTLPILATARLVLRPFTLDDAPDVQRLAGAREVASTTINVPHPYELESAVGWIGTHAESFARGKGMTLAITLRESGALCGAIGLTMRPEHARAEMGYWVGVPYWGRGYCTEAAAAVLRHAFGVLGLHRVHASHLTRNPASGRVMQKIGMRHEGHLREHFLKWEVFEDIEVYAILAGEMAEERAD
jgi:[ribosomal protein S5]-alanine N-acetyltransferase